MASELLPWELVKGHSVVSPREPGDHSGKVLVGTKKAKIKQGGALPPPSLSKALESGPCVLDGELCADHTPPAKATALYSCSAAVTRGRG